MLYHYICKMYKLWNKMFPKKCDLLTYRLTDGEKIHRFLKIRPYIETTQKLGNHKSDETEDF